MRVVANAFGGCDRLEREPKAWHLGRLLFL